MKQRLLTVSIAGGLLLSTGWTAVQGMPQEGKSKGIGPITQVKLGPIDVQMGRTGKKIFDTKCLICHGLDDKKIGPPLREVVRQRAPEWIMNVLLNVNEMLAKDPEMRKLRAQYSLSMTDQQLKQEEARQILEYLRQTAQEKAGK